MPEQTAQRTATITLDIEDFYTVINSMRDACGCEDCLRIANAMLAQRAANIQAGA